MVLTFFTLNTIFILEWISHIIIFFCILKFWEKSKSRIMLIRIVQLETMPFWSFCVPSPTKNMNNTLSLDLFMANRAFWHNSLELRYPPSYLVVSCKNRAHFEAKICFHLPDNCCKSTKQYLGGQQARGKAKVILVKSYLANTYR